MGRGGKGAGSGIDRTKVCQSLEGLISVVLTLKLEANGELFGNFEIYIHEVSSHQVEWFEHHIFNQMIASYFASR